ncbi:hypothetical protein C8Q77DRAFT_1156513 [Trametes polyzona]|nr:hypothetical protein C8Q77DRAFT_1156513 [Trametes polyzona]
MRSVVAFFALATCYGFVSADNTGPSPLRPRPRTLNTYALRHAPNRRDLTDTCVYMNSTVLGTLDESEIPTGLPSDVDSCLCMGNLPQLLSTDAQFAYTVETLGLAAAEQAFSFMISNMPTSQACVYPQNSQPLCTRENVCGFVCDAPFTAVGNLCICAEADGCSASPLSARKTSSKSRLVKRAVIKSFAAAQTTCAAHETVCGTYDGVRGGFQCVDTSTNLESCGGCAVPHPFGQPPSASGTGVDCAALPYVEDVSCQAGSCAVRSCRSGWIVNNAGTGCILDAEAGAAATAGADVYSRGVIPDQIQRAPSQSATQGPRGVGAARRSDAGSGSAVTEEAPRRARRYSGRASVAREKLEKMGEDGVHIPDVRPENVAEAAGSGRVQHPAPKKINEDWVRIPDYRRFGVV